MDNKRIFKIVITQEFKLKCSVIDENGSETIVKLHENDDEEYSLTFEFQNNNIDYIEEWSNNPDDFKQYKIEFNENEFQVVAEVLFAFVLFDFVKKTKKNCILETVA